MDHLLALVRFLDAWIPTLSGSSLAIPVMAVLCWGDGFFPPLPAGTMVAALGASPSSAGAAGGLVAVILAAALAGLLGDLTMLAIGRSIRPGDDSQFSRMSRPVLSRLDGHWTLVLSTARFVPVVRVGVFLAAGIRRVPVRRVLVLDGAAALIWASVYAVSGRLGSALGSTPLTAMVLGIVLGATAGGLVGLAADRVQARRTAGRVHPAPLVAVDPPEAAASPDLGPHPR